MSPNPTTPPIRIPEIEPPPATIAEHLEELRRRLGICLLAVLAGSGAGLWMAERLIGWLKRPAGALLPTLAFFSPTEAMVAYMKVAVVFGIAVAMPVILWQVWEFVRPGLSGRERAYGVAFVGWGSALFAGGALLAYAVLLPLFLRFLLTIGQPDLQPVISISRYLSFVTSVILSCGILFELPLLIFILAKLGIVTPHALRRFRHVAIVGLVIVAAIVTPTTDAVSLLLMAVPLIGLYEISIWVAQIAAKPPR